MTQEPDHELLGRLIKSDSMYRFPSTSAFARELGIQRTTLYRIFAGTPGTQERTMLRAERSLTWPRGSIAAVLAHDHDWLTMNFPKDAYEQLLGILAERVPEELGE